MPKKEVKKIIKGKIRKDVLKLQRMGAEEEKKLEEQRRKDERRKRWLELQKKHEVETIEDVLSKIGIK